MDKGSIWRKWDCHLHTPYSVLSNGFGDPSKDETWDNYVSQIEKAAKENNICWVAATAAIGK